MLLKIRIATLLLILYGNAFGASLKLPAIFSDNAVLQQNSKVAIWGWAEPDTRVRIFADWGTGAVAKTDEDGRWKAIIQTPAAVPSSTPKYSLHIKTDRDSILLSNILVGEVWMLTGQSNMMFAMKERNDSVLNASAEIAKANYPNIRFFAIKPQGAETVQQDCTGKWESCTPLSVKDFSAVGYYFARELYNEPQINVPIGLIRCAYSGSSIEAWLADEVIKSDARFAERYPYKSDLIVYKRSTWLYNAMIAPIAGYAIRGALWYQGESNVADRIYGDVNIAMINHWRKLWGYPFSFYAVQLTPRYYADKEPLDNRYLRADFRYLQQQKILEIPNTGFVYTSDLMQNKSERANSHPADKMPVGLRLARMAMVKNYGLSKPYLAPKYLSHTTENGKIVLYFDMQSVGDGLRTKDGMPPESFRIAEDDIFYPAKAKIIGENTVELYSPKVDNPTNVRYGYTDGAMTNLENSYGLPAGQFRTDDIPKPIYKE